MKPSYFYSFIFSALSLLYASQLHASIRFEHINIESALAKSKAENKLIFIDAYATWCGPCKVMDKVFEQQTVGSYFNSQFINIKIDMDGPYGEFLLNQYGVVWLPTLLIINSEGEIISKIDKLVSGEELIGLAQEASAQRRTANPTVFNSTPFPSSKKNPAVNDYDPNEKESILYVLDERGSSGRPHIMFHEAYLHLQLRDGKHEAVVKKYLSTQEDWNTEKNIKFIFDFTNSVTSDLFQYCINNKARFEEVIGKEKVYTSFAFLINQRLEQGYPRPGLEETIDLFKHLNPITAKETGYTFYLEKMSRENHELEYISTAEKYLETVNPHNHQVAHKLALYKLNRSDYKNHLDACLTLMTDAIVLEDQNPEYYATLAKIYFLQNSKNQALSSINRCLNLASTGSRDSTAYLDLYQKINSL